MKMSLTPLLIKASPPHVAGGRKGQVPVRRDAFLVFTVKGARAVLLPFFPNSKVQGKNMQLRDWPFSITLTLNLGAEQYSRKNGLQTWETKRRYTLVQGAGPT